MTVAIEQKGTLHRKSEGPAANDDHVAFTTGFARKRGEQTSETGGWDAYEVWRRLIKDARDRRSGASFPT